MAPKVSAPPKKFGSWLERTFDTIYQAATDGFVTAQSDNANLKGLTYGSTPPTVIRNWHAVTSWEGVCLPVKKDDYWEVTNSAFEAEDKLYWIPYE